MRVPMLDILSGVAEASGECLDDLRGPGRSRSLGRARQVAYWLGHKQGYSLPRIGQAIGGRDHTTVRHGLRRISKSLLREDDPDLPDLIRAARASSQARVVARALSGARVEEVRGRVMQELRDAPVPVLARVAGVLGVM